MKLITAWNNDGWRALPSTAQPRATYSDALQPPPLLPSVLLVTTQNTTKTGTRRVPLRGTCRDFLIIRWWKEWEAKWYKSTNSESMSRTSFRGHSCKPSGARNTICEMGRIWSKVTPFSYILLKSLTFPSIGNGNLKSYRWLTGA